jgi:hypothetical protein
MWTFKTSSKKNKINKRSMSLLTKQKLKKLYGPVGDWFGQRGTINKSFVLLIS